MQNAGGEFFDCGVTDGVLFADGFVKVGAGAGCADLGFPVECPQTKTHIPAAFPFKIIDQRPEVVTAHGDIVVECTPDLV